MIGTTAVCFLGVALLANSNTTGPSAFLHPPVQLVDADGQSVLESGRPVSTMRSCGGCHDTTFILKHSYHSDLGRSERFAMGHVPGRRAWDYSPGIFGRWSPLTYRYLSPPGETRLDLGTAEWIKHQGWRHAGGGPAVVGHGETPLNTLGDPDPADAIDPDSQVMDPTTRQLQSWDWGVSGVVELNCFLCHTVQPDNGARVAELEAGRFAWANTATLAGTGLVVREQDGWRYRREAFQADGTVAAETLGIQEPTSRHCGLCHGQVCFDQDPLQLDLSLRQWSMATKGQVFSPQKISASATNLQGKGDLTRPWDVHAEALLECTSCHFSLNNPAEYEPTPRSRPAHLRFEPRRLSIAEYLHRPNHQLAKGQTAQGTVAHHLDGTMRTCEDCHEAESVHDWLPYRRVHFARLSCEACHIVEVYAPAICQVDWSLIDRSGNPLLTWRGIEGNSQDPTSPVMGYRPVLLFREDLDGRQRLFPHNLISSWYWVEGGPAPRPVRLADLNAALLAGDDYHADVKSVLDRDGDGKVSASELRLDTAEKVAAVVRRLEAVGVAEPRIEAEIQPVGVHHGVGPARWAIRACETCHTSQSRLSHPMTLASYLPGDVRPALVGDSGVTLAGTFRQDPDGSLVWRPSTKSARLYVLGHDRWIWVTVLGGLAVVGVVVVSCVHIGLRLRASRRL